MRNKKGFGVMLTIWALFALIVIILLIFLAFRVGSIIDAVSTFLASWWWLILSLTVLYYFHPVILGVAKRILGRLGL